MGKQLYQINKDRANKVGRPLKLNKDLFPKQVDEYLALCKQTGELPTIVGLASELNIAEQNLHTTYGKREPFMSELKRVKQLASRQIITKLNSTDKPLINHIFLAKAIAGLRDNSNIDITSDGRPLGVVVLPKRGK